MSAAWKGCRAERRAIIHLWLRHRAARFEKRVHGSGKYEMYWQAVEQEAWNALQSVKALFRHRDEPVCQPTNRLGPAAEPIIKEMEGIWKTCVWYAAGIH